MFGNASRTPGAHWRILGASFFGGRGRRISAKNFLPFPKNSKFGGTAGNSLSLGPKCWLSIIMY